MDWPVTRGVLELGDLKAERGGTIGSARLAWQAHGTLAPGGDNVVVYPCSYGATSEDLTWLIGPDGVLDPTRWFVVIPDMFSGGVSSSASGTADYPPLVTAADNVRAQHRLLTEHLGVSRVAAAYGFSMGGIQAYHWAALYPDLVERAIVVCGSARTADHNKVFLSGLLRLLEAAPEHLGGGRFSAEPVASLKAFAHVYAGWGLSQDFYRQQLYRTALGAPDSIPTCGLTGSRGSPATAPPTSTRRPSRGRRLTSAAASSTAGTWPAPCRASRRGSCCCRARPTCTSGWPTTPPSSSTCAALSCARSRACGATGPAARKASRRTWPS
jgi:homoserine acetyltransferase